MCIVYRNQKTLDNKKYQSPQSDQYWCDRVKADMTILQTMMTNLLVVIHKIREKSAFYCVYKIIIVIIQF